MRTISSRAGDGLKGAKPGSRLAYSIASSVATAGVSPAITSPV